MTLRPILQGDTFEEAIAFSLSMEDRKARACHLCWVIAITASTVKSEISPRVGTVSLPA